LRNIKLILQYEGTNYAGWQIQSNKITIQFHLQHAIKKLTGELHKIVAAGRTDAGVHALEQVAAFKTNSKHSIDVFFKALNSMLPNDIRILKVEEVSLDFHPRYNAKAKRYFYLVNNYKIQSPFFNRFSFYFPYKLDIEKMTQAATYFIGKKDFRSFQASGCGAKNTIREIFTLKIETFKNIPFLGFYISGNFLKFTIEANAFLRYMVRNIIGTLIQVGRGKISPSDILHILECKNRTAAGPTLPPQGLFLEKVFY